MSNQYPVAVIAIDLGAGSGRVILGEYDGQQLQTSEIHRFINEPLEENGHLYWRIEMIIDEVKRGIQSAIAHCQSRGLSIASIGVDSWAVDYGVLDEDGNLLERPRHYRDKRTSGTMEVVTEQIGKASIFAFTGIQFLPFNTIYQLHAMLDQQPKLVSRIHRLLMIPDLIRYALTGEQYCEFTNASTTQLYNPLQQQWDSSLLNRLHIPPEWMPKVVQAGTCVGFVKPGFEREARLEAEFESIRKQEQASEQEPEQSSEQTSKLKAEQSSEQTSELGAAFDPIPVYAVGEHDTASAVVAIPARESHFAYLSCGTWSLMGTECNEPLLNDQVLRWNFTNEGGVNGTYRLLKNIMGLWLVEECKRCWEKEASESLSYDLLLGEMEQSQSFASWIDPDHASFLKPDHMPEAIQQYCASTNQTVPVTRGEILRCVLESLAMKYRLTLERTAILTERNFSSLYMVGGGIKNQHLCQFTANAIGRPVWAGPAEGSAMGNMLVQLMGLGHILSLADAREVVRVSIDSRRYVPDHADLWQQAYEDFRVKVALSAE